MRTSQTPLLAPPAAPLVLSPRFSPFRAAPLSPRFSPFRAAPLSPRLSANQLPLRILLSGFSSQDLARRFSGRLPALENRTAIDDHGMDSLGLADKPRLLCREVSHQRRAASADALRIEYDNVRSVAGLQIAAVPEAEHFGRMTRDARDRLLDTQYRCLANPMRKQVAGEIRVAQRCQMSSGVGLEQHVRILEHLAEHAVLGVEHEIVEIDGAILRHAQIEIRFERVLAQ